MRKVYAAGIKKPAFVRSIRMAFTQTVLPQFWQTISRKFVTSREFLLRYYRPKPFRSRMKMDRSVLLAFLLLLLGILLRNSHSERQQMVRHSENAAVKKIEPSRIARPGRTEVKNVEKNENSAYDIPFEELKSNLDERFLVAGAKYVTHAEIYAGDGSPPVLSLLYGKTNAFGEAPTEAEVIALCTEGLVQKRFNLKRLKQINAEDQSKLLEASADLVSANAKIAQSGRLMEIQVSPFTNNPPVILFQKGAPEWLAYRELALEIARNDIGTNTAIVRIERAGLTGVLTYVCSSFSASVYVQPQVRGVFKERQMIGEAPEALNDPQRSTRIAAQWKLFRAHGVDVSQFDTARLAGAASGKTNHNSSL